MAGPLGCCWVAKEAKKGLKDRRGERGRRPGFRFVGSGLRSDAEEAGPARADPPRNGEDSREDQGRWPAQETAVGAEFGRTGEAAAAAGPAAVAAAVVAGRRAQAEGSSFACPRRAGLFLADYSPAIQVGVGWRAAGIVGTVVAVGRLPGSGTDAAQVAAASA